MKPVPSLFTFKIDDFQLVELSGVILMVMDMPLIIFRIGNILFTSLHLRVLKEAKTNSDS